MLSLVCLFFLSFSLHSGAITPKRIIEPSKVVTISNETAPRYEQNSIEYKIQELALNIEAVLPTKIFNPDYKDSFLDTAGVPNELRDNFMLRNSLYPDVSRMKILGKIKEQKNGLLEITSSLTGSDNEKVQNENKYRTELFALISESLKLDSDEQKAKVPVIYSEVIKYLKDYSTEPELASKPKETAFLTSMTTIYSYDQVWDTIIKVLKEEGDYFLDKKKVLEKRKGPIKVKYFCAKEEHEFLIKLCTIKKSKIQKCKGINEKDIMVTTSDGTIVLVEKGKDKYKSLYVAEGDMQYQNLLLCKDNTRVFDVLDKVSELLIAVDKVE